ncbi:MAG: Npt1/Npt2 family nucleotide transporter [Simkaniaceae bacterium]|nr:Npt1/Npt2 family nucleotide transporter [Simkaniaceae bacterium]
MTAKSATNFGKWREAIWPIHRFELRKFLPLFIIYSLICFNYSILRATKDALVITAPKSGAEALPFIKVWAILPMALLFTYFFTRLSNRFSIKKIFYIMMGAFLSFFVIFSFVLYPNCDALHPNGLADRLQEILPSGFNGLITIFRNWTFTLFYVMSELWGTMIMTVLFWGFANQITSVTAAKRYYALLGLGANVASIFSGQLSVYLSKGAANLPIFLSSDTWGKTLNLVTLSVVIVGVIIIGVFRWYTKSVLKDVDDDPSVQGGINKKSTIKMSLKKNFAYLAKSKYLICIAIIVLAYNLSMNMIEIVWKDQIKLLYPKGPEFNAYMGNVMSVMGIISTFIALFICGGSLRKKGWTFTAMITPVIVLISGAFFFSTILLKGSSTMAKVAILAGSAPLAMAVFFGTIQNCFSRACKYTVFDATKEMAFIPLTPECKLKGKAAIDGVGSRLGKSGGSFMYQFLIMICGSVTMSTPYVAGILLLVIVAWIGATKSLGKQFNHLSEEHEKISIEEEEVAIPAPVASESKKEPALTP